jgi:hypothetical protein
MKRSFLVFTSGFLLAAVGVAFAVGETSVDDRVKMSRQTAKQFMQSLKGELQAAMKAGGPVNALDVCHTRAMVITQQHSDAKGWRVARTSLKTRNPANAPDAWERSVLEKFDARRKAGEAPQAMEHHEVVEQGGKKAFRWMKAIPTQAVCLKCHGGDSVAPAVEAKLKQLYPTDQARGYAIGDIRGAFTITQPID